jgi:DNA-binding response OmpR family regulator
MMIEIASNHLEIVVVDPHVADYGHWSEATADAELCFCANGEEALQLPAQRAALWFIHAELPDMSGVELFKQLRSKLRGAAAFLIADRYEPAYEVAAIASGGLHFAVKPLTAAWLDSILAQVCPEAPPAHPTAPAPALPIRS